MDTSSETPERYWVLRPFLHYSTCFPDLTQPTELPCSICGDVIVRAADMEQDDMPLLMFDDKPICVGCASEKINGHPVTATYMKWIEEGDPRWWSPWFCECESCEPLARSGR